MDTNSKSSKLNIVYNEDSRNLGKIIPFGVTLQTTITSPPYFDMKDYGSTEQIGFGQNYADYLHDLMLIFKNILKITREDGTLWIIIDSFKRNNQVVTLPFDLANKLKKIGWLLQEVLIWKKDKTVPWTPNGFAQRKFEYILFFSKSPRFKLNKESARIYDTSQLKKWWVKYPERYNPKGKALDEVWEFPIPTQGAWGSQYIRHFCPLPKEMVATMIELSTNEGDLILDPFAGSGTVLSQAAFMKRDYIGFELNKDYISLFNDFLTKTFEKNRSEYELLKTDFRQSHFEKTILDLRSLKFARILINNLQKKFDSDNFRIFVGNTELSHKKDKLIKVEYTIFGKYDKKLFLDHFNNLIQKPPLSKFGIEAVFKFSKSIRVDPLKHFGYTKTNSYSYQRQSDLDDKSIKIVSDICLDLNENDYL